MLFRLAETKITFIYLVSLTRKIFATGQKVTPENYMNGLFSQRVTVRCAVANLEVWGPYFCEVEDKGVSVTPARYVQMLQNFLKSKLQDLGENATV